MSGAAYSQEELKRIQQVELEALKVLIDICDKLDIQYFLSGGSVLGAVRHGGFIPWDDDIDVGMIRADYDRFLAEAPAYLPDKYFLQTPYNDEHNTYGYAKLRVNGTKFVEYCNRNVDMHHGVYIDIFPYDIVTGDPRQIQRRFSRYKRMSRLLVWRQCADISAEPVCLKMHIKSLSRRAVHIFLQPISYSWIMKRLDSIAQRGVQMEKGNIVAFCKTKFFMVEWEDVFPVHECLFEGVAVKIPRNYDLCLTLEYGDYMTLPPEKERFAHKPWLVDLG